MPLTWSLTKVKGMTENGSSMEFLRCVQITTDAGKVARAYIKQKYINGVTTLNFSFVLLCSWVGAAAGLQLALLNGGPASVVYGCIFAGVGTALIAISLAEMASMYDTVVTYLDASDSEY